MSWRWKKTKDEWQDYKFEMKKSWARRTSLLDLTHFWVDLRVEYRRWMPYTGGHIDVWTDPLRVLFVWHYVTLLLN